jgi:RHO1 GDP-GTP exchange protein 1/2
MVFWEGTPTGFGTCQSLYSLYLPSEIRLIALHYPYVLAFEATFVEIRHVENGNMCQIIQGNNLRCLFADTPPSTTNTASNMYYNSYQQGYDQNQYGSPLVDQYGRPSIQNGYGSPYPSPYQPRGPSTGRDEILMISDDRVMRLQLSPRTIQ